MPVTLVIMRCASILLGMVVCLVGIGCRPKSVDVVGMWKPEIHLSAEDQKNPALASLVLQMKEKTMELKQDHTFNSDLFGEAVEGTWALKNLSLTLVVTRQGGKSIAEIKKHLADEHFSSATTNKYDEPLKLTVSVDEKTLTIVETGKNSSSSMSFVRKS